MSERPDPTVEAPPLVVRHRLLGVLAERFARRVVMIEAGAGFGKTTLLDQALGRALVEFGDMGRDARVDVPPAGWSPVALLRALGAAVTGVAGRADRPVASSDDLVEAVLSMAPTEVCLVVDDVHHLDDDASTVLAALVERLPANGHLLLAGRRIPQVGPQRLELDGSVLRLGERHLAFDADERLVFARQRGIEVDDAVDDVAGGWPALLALEASVGSRTDPGRGLRYLVEEVVSGLGSDHLARCRRLAVLETIDDGLVTELTGPGATAAELARSLPLSAVLADGRVRVHELLRRALLASVPDADLAAARVAGGAALERRGQLEEALHLYIAAGANDRLVGLARHLAADLNFGAPSSARLEVLTELRTVLGDRLEVEVVAAVSHALVEPARARARLEAAAARAHEAGDVDLEALCRLHLADAAYGAADVEGVVRGAARIDELAAAGSPTAARVSFLPGIWLRALTNRHDQVRSFLDERRQAGVGDGDPELEQMLVFFEVLHRAYAGDLRGALDRIDELRHLPVGLFLNRLDGFAYVQRWLLGELDVEELADVVSLVDRIDLAGQTHLFVEGAATTAIMHFGVGAVETGAALLRRAEQQLDKLPTTAWAHHSVAQARAALAVLDGDEVRAAAILSAAVPERGVASIPRFIYGITMPLTYVLVPPTRATWDADHVGPDHVLRRDIARALVALRERGDLAPAAALPWDAPARLRPWALEPHLIELAVAAGRGEDPTLELIRTLPHDPRRHLDRLVEMAPGEMAKRARSLVKALPRRPAEVLTVAVLGPPELRWGDTVVVDDGWTRRQRVRDLLLVLVHRRRTTRSELAELLWPDKPASAADSNLRFTLSKLLSVIEADRPATEPSWFLRSDGDSVVLDGGDRLVIDVDRFTAALEAAARLDADGRAQPALSSYREACDWYRGDYLAGASEPEWGYYDAIALRGRFVGAAVRAAELLVGLGALDDAEELAVRASSAEPLNEAAHRALAQVLLARRRIGVAGEVVHRLLAVLDDIGVAPEPDTARLAARLGISAERRG